MTTAKERKRTAGVIGMMIGMIFKINYMKTGQNKQTVMKSREKINNQDRILEIARLCIEIQNKGIATAFFNLSGHVNMPVSISLHAPNWVAGESAVYDKVHLSAKDMDMAIKTLKSILENGVYAIPGYADKKAKEHQDKLNQLNKLKKELGVS